MTALRALSALPQSDPVMVRVDNLSKVYGHGEGGVVALHDSRPTPDRPIHDAGSVRYAAEVIRPDPRFEVVDEVVASVALPPLRQH